MSELRKAAEMALEALEDYRFASGFERDAIDELRKALAMEKFSEVNQEIEEAIKKGTKAWADVPDATKWVDELRGEPEQEPVAWLSKCFNEDGDPLGYTAHEQEVHGSFPVYTAPPISDYHEGWEEGFKAGKREWVGLTDEELTQAYCAVDGKEWCLGGLANAHTFYEVIEAKLKEKNS